MMTPEHYRFRAEELRVISDCAVALDCKRLLMGCAVDYETLANELDQALADAVAAGEKKE